MRRLRMPVRPQWQRRCEAVGFDFHSLGGAYWAEGVAYEFTLAQIEHLEAVTEDLHARMLAAVEWIVANRYFEPFALPPFAVEEIERSWRRGDPSLYGRFDFSWNGRDEPRLLEYNADTPTALLEASVVQWQWLEDLAPEADQFNSLHEKLIARWRELAQRWPAHTRVHFAACADHAEDQGNTAYLLDTAAQAGLRTGALCIEDIGFDARDAHFVDPNEKRITHCFKLYPWEWMVEDEFGRMLGRAHTRFIEPAWKLLLSCKAILPIIAQLNPGHPNLLPATFDQTLAPPYVRKPRYSREGANITLVTDSGPLSAPGPYGREGHIYQVVAPLPEFDGRFPVIGSWVVGDQAAGMGIREDQGPITTNTSSFVPHFFL
jgi:glutathionylspermidine synthase